MAEFPYPDVAPGFLGNWETKEIVLYSLLVFDRENVRKTLCPVIIVGESGSGKTQFLICSEEGMGKAVMKLWGADSITAPSLRGMVDKRGKIKKGKLTVVSGVDEINKWSVHTLEGVLLPVFGGEHGARMREGMEFDTSALRTVPIGTLLPGWDEFEGTGASAERRRHTIEQLLRRCIILYLQPTTEDENAGLEYMQLIFSQICDNVEYESTVDYEGNRKALLKLLTKVGKVESVYFDKDELEEAKRFMNDMRKHMVISRNVRYTEEWPKLILKLCRGRALAEYGMGHRPSAYFNLEDVKYVVGIIVKHARALGMWIERDERDGMVYDGKARKYIPRADVPPKPASKKKDVV